jgi:HEAT repeat protein
MLEVLAGTAPAEAMSKLVSESDRNDFLTFLLGYARRLRGEERDTVHALAAAYLPGLALQATRGTPEERGLAVQALAGMGMPEYASTVAQALDDDSPVVAMLAARGLFSHRQREFFPTVMRHLSRFTLWSRSYLASMLSGGGPETAPLLRALLADPAEEPIVRAVASDALRILNDLESVDVAARLLATETDREVVACCLRLVRQLGHRDHLPLVRPFATSADPVVRSVAVGAIGAIGGKEEVPLLQALLDDPEYWVSLEAARGLMALGATATLERLAAGDGPWALLARQVLSE